MNSLVAAAKQEGTLNVIALPPTWANYGAILSAFTAKYGIKINSALPDGTSQQEVNAVKTENGKTIFLKEVADPQDASLIQTNVVRVNGRRHVQRGLDGD